MKMKLIKSLALSMLVALAPAFAAPSMVVTTPNPTPAHISTAQALMAVMSAEKMMRTTAHTTRYANDKQRAESIAKLALVPAADIYRRLATPVARYVTAETAAEMTRFYGTAQGKKAIYSLYNSDGEVPGGPKTPAYAKANLELQKAMPAIRRETFTLLNLIINERK
jgi:hypothetical protein